MLKVSQIEGMDEIIEITERVGMITKVDYHVGVQQGFKINDAKEIKSISKT